MLDREVRWIESFRVAHPGSAAPRPLLLGTHGGDAERSREQPRQAAPDPDIDALHPRQHRRAPRRSPRYLALPHRAPYLSRPARDLLGPDQDDRRRKRHDRGARRRFRPECRDPVRQPSRPASPHRCPAWARLSVRRSSALPVPWSWAFSTCSRAQAQNRFYNELEEWLSSITRLQGRRRPGHRRRTLRSRLCRRIAGTDRRQPRPLFSASWSAARRTGMSPTSRS